MMRPDFDDFINIFELKSSSIVYDRLGRISSLKNKDDIDSSIGISYLSEPIINNERKTYTLPENEVHKFINELHNQSFSYGYDSYGRLTQVITNSGDTLNYGYDAFGRLSYFSDSLTSSTAYQYDQYGNIISKDYFNRGTITSNRYEYSSTNPTLLTKYNNKTYNYDGMYLTSISRRVGTFERIEKSFTYVGGKISKIDMLLGHSISYAYSYNGLIRKKIVSNITSTEVIKYIYDGNKLIQEIHPDYKLRFSYDALDRLHSIEKFTNNNVFVWKYYYLTNIYSDVYGLIDSNGDLVVSYAYDPYGAVLDVTDTSGINLSTINPFRFKSYYFDEDVSYYYLTTRFYDPEIGRFISPDDIEYLDPTSINGLNLYAYCNNDPVNYCDPSGHFGILAAIFIGLGASVLVGGGLVLGGRLSGNKALTNIGDAIISFGEIVAGIAMIATGVGGHLGMGLLGTGVGSILNGLINCSNGGTFHGGWAGGQLAGALSFIPYFGGAIGAFGGSILTDLIDSDYSLSKIDLGKAGASAALAFGLSWFGNTITWSGIPLNKVAQYVLSYDYALLSIANSIINAYWRGRNQ